MTNATLAIYTSLGGILVGNLLTRFWDKARPLVVVKGFNTVRKKNQRITISDEISTLTKQSWFMDALSEGETSLGEAFVSNLASYSFLNSTDGIDTWIRESRAAFEKAEDPHEFRSAFKQLIRWTSISALIELGIVREHIAVQEKEYGGNPAIAVSRGQEREFIFVFDNSISRFGSRLGVECWREPLLFPFVKAIQYGDKDIILKVLDQLPQLAHEQIEIHRRLNTLLDPIVEENSRWVAYLSVLNYGNSPMIIWPESKITLSSKNGGGKFGIDGYLVKITKNGDDKIDQEELKGPYIIPSNAHEEFWLISKDTESEMKYGGVVRAHYTSEDCNSHVSISVKSRAIPWKRKSRSSTVIFKEEVEQVSGGAA